MLIKINQNHKLTNVFIIMVVVLIERLNWWGLHFYDQHLTFVSTVGVG